MKSLSYKRVGYSEAGVAFIEIAIGMPIFLAMIFLLLWLTTMSNAKTALTAAVAIGTRAGGTRGDSELMNYDRWLISTSSQRDHESLLAPIDKFMFSTNYFDLGAKSLLVSPDLEAKFTTPSLLDIPVPGGKGKSFPTPLDCPTCTYSLVYIYEYMKGSIGGDVRYPCDPGDPNDQRRGEACLHCYFRPLDAGGIRTDSYGVTCRYSPAQPLHRAILNLLGGLGSDVTAEDLMLIERSGVYHVAD